MVPSNAPPAASNTHTSTLRRRRMAATPKPSTAIRHSSRYTNARRVSNSTQASKKPGSKNKNANAGHVKPGLLLLRRKRKNAASNAFASTLRIKTLSSGRLPYPCLGILSDFYSPKTVRSTTCSAKKSARSPMWSRSSACKISTASSLRFKCTTSMATTSACSAFMTASKNSPSR
ncbi:hypothetical protein [Vibrio phage VP882]|uniref:Uncharacterized protein n=1 Tax=Vibrio phage VP882 TaxID=2913982 RepID=A2I307_9CAUD|nr:hypothetical protein VPVV882_gp58 [Vibrio phage VP882]ABM73421.1 hypothetical protein [Vibrio phage VP882]